MILLIVILLIIMQSKYHYISTHKSTYTTTSEQVKWCRYEQHFVMPSHQLPQHPRGPAIWQVQHKEELVEALQLLLAEPRQRHSQGNAAVQATARIAHGMLTIAWEVLVIMVLEPALVGVPPRAMRADTSNQSATSGAASEGDGLGDDDDNNDDHSDSESGADDSPSSQGTNLSRVMMMLTA